jgi:hypothetical protein
MEAVAARVDPPARRWVSFELSGFQHDLGDRGAGKQDEYSAK